MPSRQDEVRLLMLGKSKCGRLVSLNRVAAIAGVEVGRSGELFGVTVRMAIGTALEFHLE